MNLKYEIRQLFIKFIFQAVPGEFLVTISRTHHEYQQLSRRAPLKQKQEYNTGGTKSSRNGSTFIIFYNNT